MSGGFRVKLAWALLASSLIGWPATHVLMLVTKPPDASSWVFHVLLAISWLALVLTCWDIVNTSNVREQQEDEE